MPSASPMPSVAPWDVHRLPRADGAVFPVTGGNAGIGYFIAEQLSTRGATVVLGSRSPARAEAALTSLRSRVPGARVSALRQSRRQGKHADAWPAVRAVLDPGVRGGGLWGPRAYGLRGRSGPAPLWAHLTDTSVAARLWDAGRDLTGVDPSPRPDGGPMITRPGRRHPRR
ncbi:SDR family NAD(P)-dependent oxidoreductase [Streptomyces sp. NPDC052036]|uniref:SDR family NAD(P)-dependent oxidoreductase n=1 Tax=unclassified Streptomyces TaxID=2593676 RepID=UPI003429AF4F